MYKPGATRVRAGAQMFDERLAGSPVEYLQLNDLAEALQRNLQRMHYAKCLFMMRAWHQACSTGRLYSLPGSASRRGCRRLHVTLAPGRQQLQLLYATHGLKFQGFLF